MKGAYAQDETYDVRLGDINGDGKADLVIGARHADPQGRNRAGSVSVIWGSNKGKLSFVLSDRWAGTRT